MIIVRWARMEASQVQITRTGFILYVRKYPECAAFYHDVLGLPKMFETPDLTCFQFGGSYLMVERDDEDEVERSGRPSYPTCLRMNVHDVRSYADRLIQHGVAVDYQEHEWGTVAKFVDPAGNLCAFKDDAKFEQQVRDGRDDFPS